jgi:hypothetical protein
MSSEQTEPKVIQIIRTLDPIELTKRIDSLKSILEGYLSEAEKTWTGQEKYDETLEHVITSLWKDRSSREQVEIFERFISVININTFYQHKYQDCDPAILALIHTTYVKDLWFHTVIFGYVRTKNNNLKNVIEQRIREFQELDDTIDTCSHENCEMIKCSIVTKMITARNDKEKVRFDFNELTEDTEGIWDDLLNEL